MGATPLHYEGPGVRRPGEVAGGEPTTFAARPVRTYDMPIPRRSDRAEESGRVDTGPRRAVPRPVAVRPATRRPTGTVAAPVGVARTVPGDSVRLTRRGQVVVLLVSLGMALLVLAMVGPHSAATGDAGTPVQTRTVQVVPGDTLWGIAARAAKPGHVRDMVHQIEELNAMPGASVTVGQQIAVPVG